MVKWRILIIDDEKEVRDTVKMSLELNYEVIALDSGQKALQHLETIEPDFIILDVNMPGMNGFEVCQRIKSDRQFRDTPILFISAADSQETIRKGYEMGASLYLTKPFDPIRLLKNIEVFIERTPPPYRHKAHTIDEVPDLLTRQSPPPRPAQPAAPAAPPKGAEPAATGLPRVLFALRDERLLRELALACEGRFEFVWSQDGRQSQERLAVFEPDAVVLEETLPSLNGLDVCRTIRDDAEFHDIPVFFYSPQATPDEEDAVRRAGATGLARIEPSHRTLTQLLANHLDAKRMAPKKLTIQDALDIIEHGDDDELRVEDEEI